jgi:hypothetical protein
VADLYFGIALITALAAAAFLLAARTTRSYSALRSNLLAAAALLATVLFAAFLWNDPLFVRWLPFSNIAVLANWIPLGAAFLAGIAFSRGTGPTWRKALAPAALAAVAFYALIAPLPGSPPPCENQWAGDICLQTSRKTCSPACAATLLARAGIHTTEAEMAALCLTRDGTHWTGLYRGLKLKTAGTGWDVAVLSGGYEELKHVAPAAVILAVGIPKHADVPPIYTEEWGWTPGETHSVILLRFLENNRVAIADPTPDVAKEQWTEADLKLLYQGPALYLVKRNKR